MILTSDQIYARLKVVFPALLDWLPTDKEYLTVEPPEVERMMKRHPVERYLPFLWECEEISMAFVVDTRRERAQMVDSLPVSERRNLAVGEALGSRWNSVIKQHQANIFISAHAVWLFDLQNSRMWEAKKGSDDIFFVRL